MRDLYPIFCACCLLPWLSPPPVGWHNQREGAILVVFFPIDSALYGPYSNMNFAMKDRFRLNLLIYRKVGHNLISYY